MFTNADMLELETLGPLTKLAPGASVEHVERWTLYSGAQLDIITDEAIDALLLDKL
jgi:hypothetical protein